MDGPRFDQFARTLATSSRRHLLQWLGGGALGSALFLRHGHTTAAKTCKRDSQCGKCGRCQKGRCRPNVSKCIITDGNLTTAGCVSCVRGSNGTYSCQEKANGAACLECGRCNGGFCEVSADRDCPTCQTCNPPGVCEAKPKPTCNTQDCEQLACDITADTWTCVNKCEDTNKPYCRAGICTRCNPLESICGATCCTADETCCKGKCCPLGQRCVKGKCKPKPICGSSRAASQGDISANAIRCDNGCNCPPDWGPCCDGTCCNEPGMFCHAGKCCYPGVQTCGDTCCLTPEETCCDPGQGTCCDLSKFVCCPCSTGGNCCRFTCD